METLRLKRVPPIRTVYRFFVHNTWGRVLIVLCTLCTFILTAYVTYADALQKYQTLLSPIISDRNGVVVSIKPNERGHYVYPITQIPESFAELLVKQEDRFFYYHPGLNPFSIIRATLGYILGNHTGGASTITQQLTKNILNTANERTLWNKIRETWYAISIELFMTKNEVLALYAHSVFLGNQLQGFESGSRGYFNKTLASTTIFEQASLIATLSHPSTRNPWEDTEGTYAAHVYTLSGSSTPFQAPFTSESYSFQHTSTFEITSLGIACPRTCNTTIDTELNETIRSILKKRLEEAYDRGARNGAVVVIDPKRSEVLALVGSVNPHTTKDGNQINMALEPRPIGSTVKPFIYLQGFIHGLRPYSKVDDREYKYPIATGYALYPKNFDGAYRGEVTLHEALSNSLNVPTVKVLEFVGLQQFYQFLSETLSFKPIQPLDSYQYGIALGGLEMDLLTLTHYFTIFPRLGTIAPLTIFPSLKTSGTLPPQSTVSKTHTVAEPEFVSLVQAILSDRLSSVDQFGLKSNLNLTLPSYGVKTGTSRDFHDSWIVGYTNDFVVGVWVGNVENEALREVTGQSGAGAIWHDVMEYLRETQYYTGTPLPLRGVVKIPLNNSLEWGLPQDTPSEHTDLLLNDRLIMKPHADDRFELIEHTTIPLRARTKVLWSVDGTYIETAETTRFTPTKPGTYEVHAKLPDGSKEEYILIVVEPRN